MDSRELKKICDLARAATCVVDKDGAFIYANKLVEDFFKIDCSKIIHTHVFKNPLRDNYETDDSHLTTRAVALDALLYQKPIEAVGLFAKSECVLMTAYPYFDLSGGETYIFVQHTPISPFKKVIFENNREARLHHVESVNEGIEGFPASVIAQSQKMRDVLRVLKRAARSESTLLLLGETGTGKEVLARAAHAVSPRGTRAFVAINCGAIPGDLLESELFGYEKGAFTSASQTKPGLLEMANGGTVFLDEVGELPLHLQVKLLRVLQERECTRVGGKKPQRLDIRVIAATNRDLESMVREGRFRSDLYYRLNIIRIVVPPLRERVDDIPPLAQSFLSRFNRQNKTQKRLSHKVLAAFASYPWPGNVRELENLIERLAVLSPRELIAESDLPGIVPDGFLQPGNGEVPLEDAVAEFEFRLISEAVSRHGSIRKASRALQVNHATLLRKLKKYGKE